MDNIKKLEGGDRGVLVRIVTQEILEYIVAELSLDPSMYIMSPDGSLTRFRSEMNKNLSQMVADGILPEYEALLSGDRWITVREKLNRNFLLVEGLPQTGLLALIECSDGDLQDSIGLSVADYDDIDLTVQDIFFEDSTTLRDTSEAYALALSSPYLNDSTMMGNDDTVVLYKYGTAQSVLDSALNSLALVESFMALDGAFYTTDNQQLWARI